MSLNDFVSPDGRAVGEVISEGVHSMRPVVLQHVASENRFILILGALNTDEAFLGIGIATTGNYAELFFEEDDSQFAFMKRGFKKAESLQASDLLKSLKQFAVNKVQALTHNERV